MAHGGAGPALPPGAFVDPSRWGRRKVGDALVAQGEEADVVEPCRQGLPAGMTRRAQWVGWRVLACTRQFTFVHVIWVLQMYGQED